MNASDCIVMGWSNETIESIQPIFYTCLISFIFHIIFWFQIICYSSLRQRNLMWLYEYLIIDLLLLGRFFLFYGLRRTTLCVLAVLINILCYIEAIFVIYLNLIQSYILLSLNISRYIQIRFNRNVYLKYPKLLILIHLIIYIIPLLIILFEILLKLSQVWGKEGGSCDLMYSSIWIQLFNIFISFIFPVILNLIYLLKSHKYIRSINQIQNEQILLSRKKRNKKLLIQSVIFYSIWFILWSPNQISSAFVNITSTTGTVTSLLNYIEILLDPIIISALDVRFYNAWKTTYLKLIRLRHTQRQIDPTTTLANRQRY